MLHPAFADHHVHLGLVDASGLAASGIGRVVDLGWSDEVVALAQAAPVHAAYAGRFVAAPGGYPSASSWAPPRCTSEVAEPRDAAAAVAHQVALGASVVKVTLNRDAGPVPDVAHARRRWSPRPPRPGCRSSRTRRDRAWSSSRSPVACPPSRTRPGRTGSTTR